MDIVLYFIRDKIVGVHYTMYIFVCLFFMFSIIGYLFKQKYAALELKLTTKKDKEKITDDKKNIVKQAVPVNNQANKVVLGQIPSTNIKEIPKEQVEIINAVEPTINTNQQTNVVNTNQIPEIKQ